MCLGSGQRPAENSRLPGAMPLVLCPPPSSQIAGVHSEPLPDLPHGTLDLAGLERGLTRGLGSRYHPVCELVCLENTHSSSGGRVLPLDYLRQVGPAQHCPPPRLPRPLRPLSPGAGAESPLIPAPGAAPWPGHGRSACGPGLQMQRKLVPH